MRVVERNAVRLRHLVSDLLQVAQVRDGGLQVSRSATDLRGLVRDAVEAARPLAAAGGVAVRVEAERGLVAMVDGRRLRQVIDNLLSNAIKYTDRGGSVTLGLRSTEAGVELLVADTGIGIDAAELERLFTRFFRGQQARERMAPGAGLGLNIARAIVEAHGGTIEVRSEPGVGSTFRVLLPYVAA
jgi:two-component system phosphate regulon sensor histidine kinase PhoR